MVGEVIAFSFFVELECASGGSRSAAVAQVYNRALFSDGSRIGGSRANCIRRPLLETKPHEWSHATPSFQAGAFDDPLGLKRAKVHPRIVLLPPPFFAGLPAAFRLMVEGELATNIAGTLTLQPYFTAVF